MNPDGWIVGALALTGGLAVILIPVLRGRARRRKQPGDGTVVAPFMIDGGGRGADGDGGGDGGGD